MGSTQIPVISNVRIFYAIAQESFHEMKFDWEKRVSPKPNGELGYIKRLDPEQKGFKAALKTIVFCGVCLDALLHLLIGKHFGREECKNTDKYTYEDKLAILGCTDYDLFDKCEYLRKIRKEIVHEKAYLDKGELRIAQREAEKSIASLDSICQFFEVTLA